MKIDGQVDLIEACYASITGEDAFEAFFSDLGAAIGADAGDIILEDPKCGRIRTFANYGFCPHFLAGCDAECQGTEAWSDFSNIRPAGGGPHDAAGSNPYFRECTSGN